MKWTLLRRWGTWHKDRARWQSHESRGIVLVFSEALELSETKAADEQEWTPDNRSQSITICNDKQFNVCFGILVYG